MGRGTGRRPPTNGGVHVKNIGRALDPTTVAFHGRAGSLFGRCVSVSAYITMRAGSVDRRRVTETDWSKIITAGVFGTC